MAYNIFNKPIVPLKPEVLAQERVFVYVPEATNNNKGIASFDANHFGVVKGHVSMKTNDPMTTPTPVQIDPTDFKLNNSTDKIVQINWPLAHNPGTNNTDDYGLIKIAGNLTDWLEYSSGLLQVNRTRAKNYIRDKIKIIPTYENGFDTTNWLSGNYAAIQESGDISQIKLSITKAAVGLNKVENYSVADYDERYASLFDFSALEQAVDDLKEVDESIFDSMRSLIMFQGLFTSSADLPNSSEMSIRASAIVVSPTPTYYGIRGKVIINNEEVIADYLVGELGTITSPQNGENAVVLTNDNDFKHYAYNGTTWTENTSSPLITLEWYDTYVDASRAAEYLKETDATVYQANGTPSAGSSGKWAQSNHVHPKDSSKMDKLIAFKVTSGDEELTGSGYDADENKVLIQIDTVEEARSVTNLHATEPKLRFWAGSIMTNSSSFDEGTIFFEDEGDENTLETLFTVQDMNDLGVDTTDTDVIIITGKYTNQYLFSEIDGVSNVSAACLPSFIIDDDQISLCKYEISDIPISDVANDYLATISRPNYNVGVKLGVAPIREKRLYGATSNSRGGVSVGPTDLYIDNVITTGRVLSDVNPATITYSFGLAKFSGNNVLTNINLGYNAGKIVLTDGLGALTYANTTGDGIILVSDGQVSYLESTDSDDGKVLGVNSYGSPVWVSLPSQPLTLPAKSLTTNPAEAQTGTTLVFADPVNVYRAGCLYLY